VTEPVPALWLEDFPRPSVVVEVALAPGAVCRAGWRTGGIPLLTDEDTGCVPVLEVETSRRRLLVGFDPHEELRAGHAVLAGQLAAAARALALEVGVLVPRGMTVGVDENGAARGERSSPWATHVNLRPGATRVRMEPCEGDVPWLDIVCGEALCSLSFDVLDVRELRPAYAVVADELAVACEAFADDVLAVVAAEGREGLRLG